MDVYFILLYSNEILTKDKYMPDDNQIIQYLNDANPWWQNREAPADFALYKRDAFFSLQKNLPLRQILSLVGLRRVGKTIALKQIIGLLIKEKKINPKQVMFFSFEEVEGGLRAEFLEKVLYSYFKIILGKELSGIKDRVYIFLDEIQYVSFWQGALKRFYDLNPNLKFILSGSSSLFIRKKAQESLAGRIFETKMSPLSFREYLILSGQKELSELIFKESFLGLTGGKINSLKLKMVPRIAQLNFWYQKYFLFGHFPEPITEKFSEAQTKQYIKDSVLKKILESDLPKILKVDNPEEFSTIFNILAAETGNILEYQNLARESRLNQITVKKYIHYLSEAFLTSLIYNYSKSFRPKKKFLKKHYVQSTNFSNTLFNLDLKTLLSTGAVGHLVETQVFNVLNERFERIEFWNKRGEEVDFVLDGRQLVEVKYRPVLRSEDWRMVLRILDKFKIKRGFLLSQNDLTVINKAGKEIIVLPACLI